MIFGPMPETTIKNPTSFGSNGLVHYVNGKPASRDSSSSSAGSVSEASVVSSLHLSYSFFSLVFSPASQPSEPSWLKGMYFVRITLLL